MARALSGTTGQYIQLGDITAARFQKAQTWTLLAFFKVTGGTINTGDEKTIVGKWYGGTVSSNQFVLVVDKQAAPADLQVGLGTTSTYSTGTSIIYDNTWYLAAVTSDGAGNVVVYAYNMLGAQLSADSVSFSSDNSDLTQPINIGARKDGDAEVMDGSLAHVAYFSTKLTTNEIASYVRNPVNLVARRHDSVVFYLPLRGVGSSEPDLSGNAHAGTINGTITQSANPPTRVTGRLLDAGVYLPAASSAQTVSLNEANAAAAPQTITAVPGGVTVSLNEANAAAAPQTITDVPGGVTVSLNEANAAAAPQTVTAANGLSVSLNAANAAAAPQTITAVPGGVTVSLNAANAAAAPQTVTAVPGGVTVSLNAANAAAAPQTVTAVQGQTVNLNAANAAAAPQTVTAVPGGVTVSMFAARATTLAATVAGISTVGAEVAPLSFVAQAATSDTTRMQLEWAYASPEPDGRMMLDGNMSIPLYHQGDVVMRGEGTGVYYRGDYAFSDVQPTDIAARMSGGDGFSFFVRVQPDAALTEDRLLFDCNGGGGANDYPRVYLLAGVGSIQLRIQWTAADSALTPPQDISGLMTGDWVGIGCSVVFSTGTQGQARFYLLVPDSGGGASYTYNAPGNITFNLSRLRISNGVSAGYYGNVRDLVVAFQAMSLADITSAVDAAALISEETSLATIQQQLGHSNFAWWALNGGLEGRQYSNALASEIAGYGINFPHGVQFADGSGYARIYGTNVDDFRPVLSAAQGAIAIRFQHSDDTAAERTLFRFADGDTFSIRVYASSGDGFSTIRAEYLVDGITKWIESASTDYSHLWTGIMLFWSEGSRRLVVAKGEQVVTYANGGDGALSSGIYTYGAMGGYLGARGAGVEPFACTVSHIGLFNGVLPSYAITAATTAVYTGNFMALATMVPGCYYWFCDFTKDTTQSRAIYDAGFYHAALEHGPNVVLGKNGCYFSSAASGASRIPVTRIAKSRGFVTFKNITVRALVKNDSLPFSGKFHLAQILGNSGGAVASIAINGSTGNLEFKFLSTPDTVTVTAAMPVDRWFVASMDVTISPTTAVTAYIDGEVVATGGSVGADWSSGSYDASESYIGDDGDLEEEVAIWVSDLILAVQAAGSSDQLPMANRLHSRTLDAADLRTYFSSHENYHWWSLTTDYARYGSRRFVLRRSSDGAVWHDLVRHWPPGKRSYTDGGLRGGSKYWYSLSALSNTKSESDPLSLEITSGGSLPVARWGNPVLSVTAVDRLYMPEIAEDWTPFVSAGVFSYGEHGTESATVAVVLPLYQAMSWSKRKSGWLRIEDSAGKRLWLGAFEVIGSDTGTLRVTAYGRWRAAFDLPYTAFWAETNAGGWYTLTTEDVAAGEQGNLTNGSFASDQNNRLQIALQTATDYALGAKYLWGYEVPHLSRRNIRRFEFSYATTLSAGWKVGVYGVSNNGEDTWDVAATLWEITGTGALQTGSVSLTATELGTDGYPRVIFAAERTGASYSYTGDNGAEYAKITNVKMRGIDASQVYRADIIADIVAAAAAYNPGLMSDSVALIAPTAGSTVETGAVYEDIVAGELAVSLWQQSLPTDLVLGVWDDNGAVSFGPNTFGRRWYVDVADVEIADDAADYTNQAYANYNNPSGGVARTAVYTGSVSLFRGGRQRQGVVSAPTTSLALASAVASVAAADKAQGLARARLIVHGVQTADGASYPSHYVRSHDTIVVRSIPPFLGDESSEFTVGRAEIDLLTGQLSVESLVPLPVLQAMIANASTG